MDGFALMARLGAHQPNLDVIMMTGSTDERDARLVRAIREKAFFFLTKPFDREVLLTLLERCLDARRLTRENQAHMERLEHELRAAQAFQQSLLPERTASHGAVEVAFLYEPCDELGGDFFDYVLRDETPGAMLMSDVSGHGAPAAMVTGMVKQAFHAAARREYLPTAVLERIAGASLLFPEGRYVTATCARIDPATDTLEYASAGHPPALFFGHDGSMTLLESSAPMIHPALPSWQCEQRVVRMERDDRLLLYTDGLTDAQNGDGHDFGFDQLIEVATRLFAQPLDRQPSSAEALNVLRHELARFTGGRPLDDDLTLALVRRL
jgi:two-component system sensor histidine kinase ChiS